MRPAPLRRLRPVRALVTGAAGFVGRHLVAGLPDAGADVHETDRHLGLDILDPAGLTDLFTSIRPEIVYHLAGQADVGGSWTSPVETFRTNAEGTLNVLYAAVQAGVERVVAVASADVYGQVREADLPIGEDRAFRPVSPYGASKAAADVIALQAYLGRGLAVLRARPFNHLGPGQSDRFVASAVASRIARNARALHPERGPSAPLRLGYPEGQTMPNLLHKPFGTHGGMLYSMEGPSICSRAWPNL